MQFIVPFLVSFVLALTIGTLWFPTARPKVKQPPPRPARAAPTLDFLPSVPSLVVPPLDDVSRQYKEAWQALRSGRYSEAERAYLEILIRHPQDQKAMDALVMVQRLAANEDRGVLQNQATRFRRAITGDDVEAERYTRQEMALLAKATESALSEIAAEHALRLTALSRTSIGGALVRSDAAVETAVAPAQNPLTGVRSRIVGIATSLGLVSGKPAPGPTERVRFLRRTVDPRSPRPALVTPARASPLATAARPGTTSTLYPLTQPPRAGTPVGGHGNAMPSTSPGGPIRPDKNGKGSAGPAAAPHKEGGHERGAGGDGGSGKGGGGSAGASGGSGSGTGASGGGSGSSGSGTGASGGGSGSSGGGTGASGGGSGSSGGGTGASGGGSGGTSAGGTGAGAGGAGKPGKAGNDESDDKGDKSKGEKGDKGDKGKGKGD